MGAPAGGGGSSFLGTAAATVAGVVGGAMLLDGIRSMMGTHHSFAGDYDHASGSAHAASPWDSGSDPGSGNLARDAGLDDVGGGSRRAAAYDDSSGTGMLSDDNQPDDQSDDDFDAGDMGDGGDYDTA